MRQAPRGKEIIKVTKLNLKVRDCIEFDSWKDFIYMMGELRFMYYLKGQYYFMDVETLYLFKEVEK